MMRVETQTNDRFLATWLLTAGAIRGPETQKLLPAPGSRRSTLLFDPVLEVGYLAELSQIMPREKVLGQFHEEMATAIIEKRLSRYTTVYVESGSELVESKSGLGWERLNQSCVFEEAEAGKTIREILSNKNEALVVQFSPKNHDLGYGDNMVAIWVRVGDTIQRMGFKVKGDLETTKRIYQRCGGVVDVHTNWDFLANPVEVKDLKLADIFNLMVLEDEVGKLDSDQIR